MLVRAAAATGMRRLGDVARLAHAAGDREQALTEIRIKAEELAGGPPSAVAPDVLVMLLLHDHPDNEALEEAARGEGGFSGGYTDAAIESGRGN